MAALRAERCLEPRVVEHIHECDVKFLSDLDDPGAAETGIAVGV